MKKKFKNSLATYSITAVALLSNRNAESQIVYTDIDPDASFDIDGTVWADGGSINLDLDANGITDIMIGIEGFNYIGSDYGGTGVFASAYILNENFEILGADAHNTICCSPYVSWNGEAPNLLYEQSIGPAGPWFNDPNGSALMYASNYVFGSSWIGTGTWNLGLWGEATNNNHYIGFRKKAGANYKYGWIRLSTEHITRTIGDLGSAQFKLTVHDFAINNSINDPLFAGEGLPLCSYAPIPLETINITPVSAKLQWEAVVGADKYQIFIRPVGAGPWQKIISNSNQKNITGLTCNIDYEWKVKAKCTVLFSGFFEIQHFTTGACKLENANAISDQLDVFPNPAFDLITINLGTNFNGYSELDSEFNLPITIQNLLGEEVYESVINSPVFEINIEHLQKGVYFLNISNDQSNRSVKFIKQ